IQQGKFTGEVIGYQYVSHTLALFPLVLLLFYRKTRILGGLLTVVYLLGRLDDPWGRHSVVALLLALAMMTTARQRRLWPRWPWVLLIAFMTVFLTVRGHVHLEDFMMRGGLSAAAIKDTMGKGDTAMLPTLYLESYLADKGGFTYGLPFLNKALFGAIPRKYFPQKDNAIENLLDIPGVTGHEYLPGYDMLYGAKSTVIGDLYTWGGIIAVALGMAVIGFACRRLDGMLHPGNPAPVQVLAFVWLADLWMLLAGTLAWASGLLYLSGLPFFVLAGWHKIRAIFRPGPSLRQMAIPTVSYWRTFPGTPGKWK
ncbi:MAG: hypothetical protein ACUVRZ_11000, partial [Desulfobacca sp.]|uniref:hypothetical protein n=1 Tax=Desulfobacca sp. TaxID=2067990 RepID=UPI00404B8052